MRKDIPQNTPSHQQVQATTLLLHLLKPGLRGLRYIYGEDA